MLSLFPACHLLPGRLQVLEYLAKGFLYKEISRALDISYEIGRAHV